MSLPTRFHIGTQRAASTYLYNLLKQHSKAALSPRQEVNFYHKHFNRGTGWYRDQFPDRGLPIDTSPKYFQKGETAAPRIKRTISPEDAKFLLILRNPIDYVHSHFTMHNRNGHFRSHPKKYPEPADSLLEHLERYPFYRTRALYARVLEKSWFADFDLEQFKIILFERFVDDPRSHLQEIQRFFDLPPRPTDTVESSKNRTLRHPWLYRLRSWVIRFESIKKTLKQSALFNRLYDRFLTADPPELSAADRRSLASYFAEDVDRLRTLLDRTLEPWEDFARTYDVPTEREPHS